MEERYTIIAMSAFLFLYSSSVVACRVVWPWRGPTKGLLAQCCHRLRPRAVAAEEAAVERRVREECRRRRVERAGTLLVLSCFLTAYHCFMTVRNAAVGRSKLDLPQMVILNALMFVRTTAAFFPKRLTPRSVDVLYCLSMASIASWSWFVGSRAGIMQILAWRVSRLVNFLYWSLFDLKPPLNALGALCLLLTEAAQLVRTGGPFELILPAVLAYSVALVGLLVIDACLRDSVRFEILATDSKSELTAIQTLLNSICDVIIQLDGQLRMKQHCPKLAQILLQPSNRSLAGVDLRDHMAADVDRTALAERLRISDGQATHAAVFHARLRDSTNSNVAMEFFTVGFKGSDGGQHHIVGMREHTDIQPLATQQRGPPPPPVQVVLPRRSRAEGQAPPYLGTPRSLEQRDLRSHRGSSATASAHSGSADGQSDSDSESAAGARVVRPGVPAAAAATSETTPALAAAPSLEAPELAVATAAAPAREAAEVAPAAAAASAREASEAAPAAPTMETSEAAKVATARLMLMSWAAVRPPGSCCPKHAAVAGLRSVAASLSSEACAQDFGPTTEWQCRRCGIMADEYKQPERRSRCLLCKLIGRGRLGRGEGGVARALVAL